MCSIPGLHEDIEGRHDGMEAQLGQHQKGEDRKEVKERCALKTTKREDIDDDRW